MTIIQYLSDNKAFRRVKANNHDASISLSPDSGKIQHCGWWGLGVIIMHKPVNKTV